MSSIMMTTASDALSMANQGSKASNARKPSKASKPEKVDRSDSPNKAERRPDDKDNDRDLDLAAVGFQAFERALAATRGARGQQSLGQAGQAGQPQLISTAEASLSSLAGQTQSVELDQIAAPMPPPASAPSSPFTSAAESVPQPVMVEESNVIVRIGLDSDAGEVDDLAAAMRKTQPIPIDSIINGERANSAAPPIPLQPTDLQPGDSQPSPPVKAAPVPRGPYIAAEMAQGADDVRNGTVGARNARMVVGEGDSRVALTVRLAEDGVRVHAQTATADAADAMEGASSELGDSLRDQGMELASFTASSDGEGDDADDNSRNNNEAETATAAGASGDVVTRGVRVIA